MAWAQEVEGGGALDEKDLSNWLVEFRMPKRVGWLEQYFYTAIRETHRSVYCIHEDLYLRLWEGVLGAFGDNYWQSQKPFRMAPFRTWRFVVCDVFLVDMLRASACFELPLQTITKSLISV